MPQPDESRDNFTPLNREKKLAGRLVSLRASGAPDEVLEGGHLHHRGDLRLDLLPALMEDTGIVLGAAVTPEDAALEKAWTLDSLQNFLQGDIGRRPPQRVASSGATERADEAVLSKFLEDLGEETLGEALSLGDCGELHHRS